VLLPVLRREPPPPIEPLEEVKIDRCDDDDDDGADDDQVLLLLLWFGILKEKPPNDDVIDFVDVDVLELVLPDDEDAADGGDVNAKAKSLVPAPILVAAAAVAASVEPNRFVVSAVAFAVVVNGAVS
jgi:hypothetical protein